MEDPGGGVLLVLMLVLEALDSEDSEVVGQCLLHPPGLLTGQGEKGHWEQQCGGGRGGWG